MLLINTSKTTAAKATESVFYMIPTFVGPLGSNIDGVKVGTTAQEMWGRLRAYEQPGIQYTAISWVGRGRDIGFLESKFIDEFDEYNMRKSFSTVCTEVFIGKVIDYADEVDGIINYYKLDVRFQFENYTFFNKTDHDRFVSNYTWKPRTTSGTGKTIPRTFQEADIWA